MKYKNYTNCILVICISCLMFGCTEPTQPNKSKEYIELERQFTHLLEKYRTHQADKEKIKKFEVICAYYHRKDEYSDAKIKMVVKNNMDIPLSKLHLTYKLISPERAVPWVKSQEKIQIPGGIEPSEQLSWTLEQGMFSYRHTADAPEDAVFSVDVVRVEDADGEPIPALKTSMLEKKLKETKQSLIELYNKDEFYKDELYAIEAHKIHDDSSISKKEIEKKITNELSCKDAMGIYEISDFYGMSIQMHYLKNKYLELANPDYRYVCAADSVLLRIKDIKNELENKIQNYEYERLRCDADRSYDVHGKAMYTLCKSIAKLGRLALGDEGGKLLEEIKEESAHCLNRQNSLSSTDYEEEVGKRNKVKEIQSLLEKAKEYESNNYLISPKEENAVSAYQEVLKLEPSNEIAIAGLNKSYETLFTRVDKLISKYNYEEARKTIEDISAIYNDQDLIAKYRSKIDKAEAARNAQLEQKKKAEAKAEQQRKVAEEIKSKEQARLEAERREKLSGLPIWNSLDEAQKKIVEEANLYNIPIDNWRQFYKGSISAAYLNKLGQDGSVAEERYRNANDSERMALYSTLVRARDNYARSYNEAMNSGKKCLIEAYAEYNEALNNIDKVSLANKKLEEARDNAKNFGFNLDGVNCYN